MAGAAGGQLHGLTGRGVMQHASRCLRVLQGAPLCALFIAQSPAHCLRAPCSPAAAFLPGHTLVVDGGEWMCRCGCYRPGRVADQGLSGWFDGYAPHRLLGDWGHACAACTFVHCAATLLRLPPAGCRPPLVPRELVSQVSRGVESKSRAVGLASGGSGGTRSKL